MVRNDHYISKVLSASLMGDGYLNKEGDNENVRYRLTQIDKHEDHVNFLASVISSVTRVVVDRSAPKEEITICGKQTRASGCLRLRTMRHPMYTAMHTRWYLQKVKRIDPHAMTLIDAEFMAIWYMEDGYTTSRSDCVNDDTVLCTDSFSYGDLMMVRGAIIEKTGFVFNVRKKGINTHGEQTYRMYLYRKQTPAFREFIAPFIQPSFTYKITGDSYKPVVG